MLKTGSVGERHRLVVAAVFSQIRKSSVVTIDDLLDGHGVLDVECLDRIYLKTYVPNLQVGGQIARFLTGHEGAVIPSPALLEKRGTAFRRAVEYFAVNNGILVGSSPRSTGRLT